jgi:hypothetical protein
MRYIELTQGQRAKVDDADYEELSKYEWCACWDKHTRSYYAKRGTWDGSRMHTIAMSRQIMGAAPGEKVDHWNHDTLDNQRENLRKCTNSQNQQNRKSYDGKTSMFKGVDWHKSTSKWHAQIALAGKKMHIGYFTNERSAAMAYDARARELFGEFALTNF